MNPRRYSQIERALHILDKSDTIDLLKDDGYLLFLFKKIERISAALYVITGLFPDTEPLKWTLRECGTSLLRCVLSAKERASAYSKESFSDTLNELTMLFSLIDIASVADLLSPMNFSILKKELELLRDTLEGKWHTQDGAVSPPFFTENFFGIPKEFFTTSKGKGEVSFSPVPGVVDEQALHSFSELGRLSRPQLQKDTHKGQVHLKDNVLNKALGAKVPHRHTPVAPRREFPLRTVANRVKEERRQRIFSVLKAQGSAVIKDLSPVINGCSEKTIQRLLVEMVRGGVLKREGDRRWSRYSLTSTSESSGTTPVQP